MAGDSGSDAFLALAALSAAGAGVFPFAVPGSEFNARVLNADTALGQDPPHTTCEAEEFGHEAGSNCSACGRTPSA